MRRTATPAVSSRSVLRVALARLALAHLGGAVEADLARLPGAVRAVVDALAALGADGGDVVAEGRPHVRGVADDYVRLLRLLLAHDLDAGALQELPHQVHVFLPRLALAGGPAIAPVVHRLVPRPSIMPDPRPASPPPHGDAMPLSTSLGDARHAVHYGRGKRRWTERQS